MKNVVLISLDTLRADVAYSGKFTTIEMLRKSGVSFETVVASSPITPVSHASVFTGLQPPNHGIRHLLQETLRPGLETLASRLADVGYKTGGIVSCPGMNKWYGHDRGFSHYDDWIPPLADGRDALEVVDVELRGTALKRAPLVVERALQWVEAQSGGPIFLFVHFFDAHWPYEPPQQPPEVMTNPYEGEVWYMDHHLEKLLSGLERCGLNHENTLFVLFSDHGEDLNGWYPNDHGGELGHPEEKGHGCLLFDATQLVPLVVCDPAVKVRGVIISDQVRLVDIAPTVLELLGIQCFETDGRSLAPLIYGEQLPPAPAYCEAYYREELASMNPAWAHLLPLKAVRSQNGKIIWEDGGTQTDVYDLLSDPHERAPERLIRAT